MPNARRALIVTGASSGIGRAIALEAALEGYDVLIAARRAPQLEEVAQSIRSGGASCAVVAADITARDAPARIIAAALHAFGRIDVLINNAGAGAYGTLLEQSDAEIEAQWQLNVAAPLRLARATLPHLAATRGQLVFLGSGVARIPLPRQGAYALSKAAIRAASTQLRRELRPQGVAVTYVDPGLVATEFHSSSGVARPNGAIAAPDRVARAILRGVRHRSAVVSAVPWQTAVATLAEWAGTLADPIVRRFYTVRRAPPGVVLRSDTERAERKEADSLEAVPEKNNFEKALEPVARRMERVKLPERFLREALVPDATLELGALAMQWTGMPNKNERAVLREALDALAASGYLESVEDETWRVLRSPD